MAIKGIKKCFEYNGAKIPSVGIGTAFMTSNIIADVIYSSIKDGTRLIDTAAVYGSEEGVGKGIKKAISEGIVNREVYLLPLNYQYLIWQNLKNQLKNH